MLDHVGLNVGDLAASKAFYEQALRPLGYSVAMEFPGEAVGFHADRGADFWIGRRDPTTAGTHVAFTAADRAAVDAFHAAALEAGGSDNGAPGPRPQYHEHYYGAYVLDPDGNNVEAVCHTPDG
jgi:catechol 2,3-dioxygenase-like lactoylglutathione lyase family enzyme